MPYSVSEPEPTDRRIVCRDCNAPFVWSTGEQQYYAARNLTAPKSCRRCRAARKTRREPEDRLF
jgi:hypothetical protein